MKRLMIFAGLLFVIVIGITGCYKDVVLPVAGADPNAPPKQYSFKTDIAPMLNMDCAKSGCHVAGGRRHPTWKQPYPTTVLLTADL